MKPFPFIPLLWALAQTLAPAQSVPDEPVADPVLDAIRQFNERDRSEPAPPNEVTVTLEPPAPAPAPVLVTGKPPENVELVTESPAPAPLADQKLIEPPIVPDEGLSVDVEKLQSGKGVIHTGQIKLLAPFPAKPLSTVPAGWKLDPQADVPAFQKEVELAPGQKISLTIRPHLLVPDTDSATTFTIREPGYNPTLGYQQKNTVAGILSRSTRQLEAESIQLGIAIDQLQQLLVSLPAPDSPPPAPPAPIR